jgi:hypothetical protein
VIEQLHDCVLEGQLRNSAQESAAITKPISQRPLYFPRDFNKPLKPREINVLQPGSLPPPMRERCSTAWEGSLVGGCSDIFWGINVLARFGFYRLPQPTMVRADAGFWVQLTSAPHPCNQHSVKEIRDG